MNYECLSYHNLTNNFKMELIKKIRFELITSDKLRNLVHGNTTQLKTWDYY